MAEDARRSGPGSGRRADDLAKARVDLDRETLAGRLAGFERRAHDLGDRRAAAVTVTVVVDDDGPGILVTRRAAKLRAHPGQWALPGGRIDEGEDAEQAALRELREEVGLALPPDVVLGRLDDYSTRSGYRITPVVLWAGAVTDAMTPNPDEVASVHVAHARDYDVDPMFAAIPESPDPIIRVSMLGAWIHAPTAAVVYQFRELGLHGRTTRVAHFEQPVFAWR
ncbi:MAG TPA: CoA pyrophosphatase [Mycobacteriales bacterium]|nr:CoA pyrophosphatase [Mycobacteriales bacterium]